MFVCSQNFGDKYFVNKSQFGTGFADRGRLQTNSTQKLRMLMTLELCPQQARLQELDFFRKDSVFGSADRLHPISFALMEPYRSGCTDFSTTRLTVTHHDGYCLTDSWPADLNRDLITRADDRHQDLQVVLLAMTVVHCVVGLVSDKSQESVQGTVAVVNKSLSVRPLRAASERCCYQQQH
ncbi:hypothetical protein DPX16_15836 [Anabarilius grahami]|uniref:Uncharacterized protein n=1 Tax=Anabarilius grahami TaxID=495550 RepID=A0A3N0YU65_ANAGA|nr:hypothetical protein DPX16_15836 [Anabarilius grahami]